MNVNQKQTSEILTVVRSSRQRWSVTKGALRSFANFTGKYICQSLFFNKVAGLSPAILSKKRLWHRYFPENFVKFLITPFFIEHFRRLLLSRNSDDEEEGAEYKATRIISNEWCVCSENSLWQMLFIVGIRSATLLKTDSNSGVFLWNLQNL